MVPKYKIEKIFPPIAKKKPRAMTLHDQQRTDNYAWMKDPNWQEVIQDPSRLSSDIREHLDAENNYLKLALKNTVRVTKGFIYRVTCTH